MKNLTFFVPCLAFASVVHGATISLDFETANQFTNNFRVVRGTAGTTIGQTTGLANNYFYGAKPGINPEAVVAIYDTTPGDANDAAQTFGGVITMDFNIATQNGAQAVGVYLFNPADVTKNIFVSFTINQTGGRDDIKFRQNGSLSGGTPGADYTNFTGTGGTAATNYYYAATAVAHSGESTPVFYGLTLTYTPRNNNDTTLTLAYGESFSATAVLSNNDRIDNPGLAFYISNYSTGGTTKIDDIVITTVPEPASAAFLLGGIAGCLLIIRRKRRT